MTTGDARTNRYEQHLARQDCAGLLTSREAIRNLPAPLREMALSRLAQKMASTSPTKKNAQKPLHKKLSQERQKYSNTKARKSPMSSPPAENKNVFEGKSIECKPQSVNIHNAPKWILKRESKVQDKPALEPAVQKQAARSTGLFLPPNWEMSVCDALSKHCNQQFSQPQTWAGDEFARNDHLYRTHSWCSSALLGSPSDTLTLPEVLREILHGEDDTTTRRHPHFATGSQSLTRHSQHARKLYVIVPTFDVVSRRLCWWSLTLHPSKNAADGEVISLLVNTLRELKTTSEAQGKSTEEQGKPTEEDEDGTKWYSVSPHKSVLAQARSAAGGEPWAPRSTSRFQPGELQELRAKHAESRGRPRTPPNVLTTHQLNLLSSFHGAHRRLLGSPTSPSTASRDDSAIALCATSGDNRHMEDGIPASNHDAWKFEAFNQKTVSHEEMQRRVISWASSIEGGVAL